MIDYRVIGLVPISNKNSVIPSRIWEGNWNLWSAKDPDPSKTTSSLVECKRGEVIEASYLILDLKNVCEVLSWWNRAGCSIYTIFKRIPPLLDSVPTFYSFNVNSKKLQEYLLIQDVQSEQDSRTNCKLYIFHEVHCFEMLNSNHLLYHITCREVQL